MAIPRSDISGQLVTRTKAGNRNQGPGPDVGIWIGGKKTELGQEIGN